MSLEASDFQTDDDYEDLRTKKKRISNKPPSPRSPYLSSLNVSSKRVAMAAWRLPRASLGDASVELVETLGASASARLTSLSNGHDPSQSVRSECDVTAEILTEALASRNHKQFRSSSNGRGDYRDKEEMYDDNIRLKKSLQAQRSDNQQLKAKLRRLEEEKTRREKQIEELLDPTKGPEYARSFVDKKREGSVVIKGLKQRILKLEQQCSEKENALSKLQSELRTTNLEELKITVETYFEEIQRLRMLLNVSEKSRAEMKGSQRQQKALGSTVLRLSENLKQLQQENLALREELNTDSPVEGVKGYREWSKQRLMRRLLELEKRLEDGRKHAQLAKSSSQSDQGVQTMPMEMLDVSQAVAMVTEEVFPLGTTAAQMEEVSLIRGRVDGLEEQKMLQEMLINKDVELQRLKDEFEKEREKWKAEHVNKHEKEKHVQREELMLLQQRIQTLEEYRHRPAPRDPASASPEALKRAGEGPVVEEDQEMHERERSKDMEEEQGDQRTMIGENMDERRRLGRSKKDRESAARTIQRSWRKRRDKDIVMLQSALRGHLLRQTQLRDLHHKIIPKNKSSDADVSEDGELDVDVLTTIQSVFRGHLARCGLATQSSYSLMPSTEKNCLPILEPRGRKTSSRPVPMDLHCEPDSRDAAAIDSDDSDDDIIMSPTRPLRPREKMLL